MALLADVWRLTVTSPGLTAPLLAAPPSERVPRLHEQSAQTRLVQQGLHERLLGSDHPDPVSDQLCRLDALHCQLHTLQYQVTCTIASRDRPYPCFWRLQQISVHDSLCLKPSSSMGKLSRAGGGVSKWHYRTRSRAASRQLRNQQ